MEFSTWLQRIDETTLPDLYQSAVDAFPRTTKRQFSTDLVQVVQLNWIPYKGMKTLFVKGLIQNEGKEYNSHLIFKGVNYDSLVNQIKLVASDNQVYTLSKLDLENTDVLIRCNCPDFRWRFCHFNSIDKSLYGRDRKKYEAIHRPGSANPLELPGMCKHLIKLQKVLLQSGVIE